ncbi:MAG: KH domain-containing protein [Anaerolineales bacterium]|nr:MAG: KH domain-containing protein [Anaerolineales bacterium]
MPDIKELVEYMAQSLVNDPEAVVVEEVEGASATIYELSVASNDMGRVIGKQGRVANAMRTLLRVAAVKEGKRVTLEIV